MLCLLFVCLFVCLFVVLNVTFNNIWAISRRSVLLVEETGGPRENHTLPCGHDHEGPSWYFRSWRKLNVTHRVFYETANYIIVGNQSKTNLHLPFILAHIYNSSISVSMWTRCVACFSQASFASGYRTCLFI